MAGGEGVVDGQKYKTFAQLKILSVTRKPTPDKIYSPTARLVLEDFNAKRPNPLALIRDIGFLPPEVKEKFRAGEKEVEGTYTVEIPIGPFDCVKETYEGVYRKAFVAGTSPRIPQCLKELYHFFQDYTPLVKPIVDCPAIQERLGQLEGLVNRTVAQDELSVLQRPIPLNRSTTKILFEFNDVTTANYGNDRCLEIRLGLINFRYRPPSVNSPIYIPASLTYRGIGRIS